MVQTVDRDVIGAMMIKVRCPSCKGDDVKSHDANMQLYSCNRSQCPLSTFRLDYVYETQTQTYAENAQESVEQIHCPSCDGEEIRKFGKRQGKQIYRCNNSNCERTTFRRDYVYKACDPRVKSHILDLASDGNGARAIGRMLSISKDTVANTLKNLEEESSRE